MSRRVFVSIERNIVELKEEINEICQRVGRSIDEITLIAVTKYVTIKQTKEVLEAGITNIAENRLEGLQEKQAAFSDQPVHWHFIGNLQSRRVKSLINEIDYFHALDRQRIAKEINKRAEQKVSCFVQVNISGEETKNGIHPSEVFEFIHDLKEFSNIEVVGLMTMAPYTDDQESIRSIFRELRELRDQIAKEKWSHAPCTELSMGMSHDYQIAIEEGATHLRIGTRIVK